MIRTLLFESNTLLREGLSMLLNKHPDIEVIGSADDEATAEALLANSTDVDVVLCDLTLAGERSFDFIKQCKKQRSEVAVLALADNCSHGLIRSALLADVDGYALKESSVDEFLHGIQTVAKRGIYFPGTVLDLLIAGYLNPDALKESRAGRKEDAPLTPKEQDVLILVAEGRTNKMIARHLNIAVKTVEKHRANFMRKLGLKNSAQVARYAVSHGLLDTMMRTESDSDNPGMIVEDEAFGDAMAEEENPVPALLTKVNSANI